MRDTLQRLIHKTLWLHLLLLWFVAQKAAAKNGERITRGHVSRERGGVESSQLSGYSFGAESREGSGMGSGRSWAPQVAQRQAHLLLPAQALTRTDEKGVVILLGVRPGISTLHSVQVPQELFFEDFDLSDRFRNNAWIVLSVASWGVSLHTAFCTDKTGWACIYMSCWHAYIS